MADTISLEKTDKCRLHLRRFSDHPCTSSVPGHVRHDAIVVIGESSQENVCQNHCHQNDDRWPQMCSCGYVFKESDSWQLYTRLLYRRSDTNETLTLDDIPAELRPN